MRYTDVQAMRKKADAAYEHFLSPSTPYRSNPPMGGAMYAEPAVHTWAFDKAKDLYGYVRDFKKTWPEIKRHPGDASKSFTKGLSARTADATQGLYDLTVSLPAAAGSWLGDKSNDLIYWGLNNMPRSVVGDTPNNFNAYRLRYKDAIPQSKEQVQAPMQATVHAVDDAIQNSAALKERALSGKSQEVMRRLGGIAGTAGETALYAGAFGGIGGLKAMLKHPVSSFGSDLAFQYGLGNRQSESLASGAARTYWQQAQEKANQIARDYLDQEYKETGIPDISTLLEDRRLAKQYAAAYAPNFYNEYVQGLQYK